MSQIKQLQPKEGVTLLAVKVPEGAENIELEEFDVLVYDFINENLEIAQGFVNLPANSNKLICSWQLIGNPEQITEEVWQGVVESNSYENVSMPDDSVYTIYRCYLDDSFMYDTATESAMSFLSAHDIDINSIILMKQND